MRVPAFTFSIPWPWGNTIFVANTNSDTVSVIDATKDKVVQTISTQPWPEATIGYEPTSISLTADGHLLVTLGRANTALAGTGGNLNSINQSLGTTVHDVNGLTNDLGLGLDSLLPNMDTFIRGIQAGPVEGL